MNRKIAYSCFVDAKPKFEKEVIRWVWSLVEKLRVDPEDIYITCARDVSEELLEFFAAIKGVNVYFEERFTEVSPPANKWLQLKALGNLTDEYTHVLVCDCDKVFIEFSPDWCDDSVRACRFIPRPTFSVFEEIFSLYFNSMPRFIEQRPDPDDELRDNRSYVNNHNGGLIIIPVSKLAAVTEAWKRWIDKLLAGTEILRSNVRNLDQVAFAVSMHELQTDINFLPATLDLGPNITSISEHVLAQGSGQLILHVHGSEDKEGRVLYGDKTPEAYRALIDKVNDEYIAWKETQVSIPA